MNTDLKYNKSNKEEIIQKTDEIIKLFLNGLSDQQISHLCGIDEAIVNQILQYKSMIIQNFGSDIYKKIVAQQNINQEKIEEGKKYLLAKELISTYLDSLYRLDQLSRRVCVNVKNITDIFSDEEFINKYFEEGTFSRIKNHSNFIKRLTNSKKNSIIVRHPEYRRFLKSDIVAVTPYEYKIIERVYLFLATYGSLENLEEDDCNRRVDIVNTLHDSVIVDLLDEKFYKYYCKLLKVYDLLNGNSLSEKKSFISKVITCYSYNNYDLEKTSIELDLPMETVISILSSSMAITLSSIDGVNFRYETKNKVKVKVLDRNI